MKYNKIYDEYNDWYQYWYNKVACVPDLAKHSK